MTTMTTGQTLAAIAVMAVVTFLTRALPFLLFDRGGEPPKVVLYLGRVLPPGSHRHAHRILFEGSILCHTSGLGPRPAGQRRGSAPPSVEGE